MKVYLVYDDSGCHEGPFLRSIWATKEAAEAEARKLDTERGYVGRLARHSDHVVEEEEVRT